MVLLQGTKVMHLLTIILCLLSPSLSPAVHLRCISAGQFHTERTLNWAAQMLSASAQVSKVNLPHMKRILEFLEFQHRIQKVIFLHFYLQICFVRIFLPLTRTTCSHLTFYLSLTVLVATINAQWEGMGDVGSARYKPALLPPCPTTRVLGYSN